MGERIDRLGEYSDATVNVAWTLIFVGYAITEHIGHKTPNVDANSAIVARECKMRVVVKREYEFLGDSECGASVKVGVDSGFINTVFGRRSDMSHESAGFNCESWRIDNDHVITGDSVVGKAI